MKNICLLGLIMIVSLMSCKEDDLHVPYGPNDNVPPGKVEILSYTPLAGGAEINFRGPADADFTLGGLQFVDEVKGGNIPKEFIPAVQKGFTNAMKSGVLAGYPLDSLKVTLVDGSFHPVDSDQLSFEICAMQAYKNA